MVLAAAISLGSLDPKLFLDFDVSFLSVGTDGIDGPTDVAGAVADQSLVEVARTQCLDHPQKFLEENNSYNFFRFSQQALLKIKVCYFLKGLTYRPPFSVCFLLLFFKNERDD